MSRVFRALEKAEKEKQGKTQEEPSLRIFEERAPSIEEEFILKPLKEKREEWELPPREEIPTLIPPTHSFAAEQFRQLKTQIFFKLSKPPHIILITSAVPGEGKTVVAVNLAMTISKEIQRKALLVDGDLRKPSIHLEKNPKAKGLSHYLVGKASLSEILLDSEVENLQVILAGSVPKNASELFGSKRMEELFNLLRISGDNTYTVIDSPPIISASEPALLSRMVDA